MTTFNITSTAADQIQEVTVTLANGESTYAVPEDGVYESSTPVQARIEVVLCASCPADALSFQQNGDVVDIRVEGSGSAPPSMPLRISTEAEVSAVHWHKGYVNKVSKVG